MLNSENVPAALAAIHQAYSALPDPTRPHVLLTDHDMLAEVDETNSTLTGSAVRRPAPSVPGAIPPGAGPAGPAPAGVPANTAVPPGATAPGVPASAAPAPLPGGDVVSDVIVMKAITMLKSGAVAGVACLGIRLAVHVRVRGPCQA